MAFNLGAFGRQLGALIYKDFLVSVARRPVGFLLAFYGFPLAILAVLCSIPSFTTSANSYGVADPVPIKSLASTINGKLVVVKPPGLGPDVDRVIDTFTEPLNKDNLQFIEDENELITICLADVRGNSDCHAAVTFTDSPLTTGRNRTWQYVVRGDPAQDDSRFHVEQHDTDQETLYLPLQLAINNAITNSTIVPEVVMFTPQTQEEQEKFNRDGSVYLIGQTFTFALAAVYLTIIYRLTSFITAERDSGMSQLIDAMGGGSAASTRTLAWLIVIDVLCLPCFIAFGALYSSIVFSSVSAGTLIGWQVLSGFAVNSATVFASSFFTKARVSAICVFGAFLLLSVGAHMYSFQREPKPGFVGVLLFSLLFPSANHVFVTEQMCLWQLDRKDAVLNALPVEQAGINTQSYHITVQIFFALLAVQIFVYPALAILVEHLMHGIEFKKRAFTPGSTGSSGVVAETFDLEKEFSPGWLKRLCCCGRRRPVHAVNGVSLQGHRGQILCLVGPNGSGKTTTLHMMSGFISPSAGSIQLDALPSQIGICPQRNTLWDELTVLEHVRLWSRIKAGRETPEQIDQLIDACDLGHKRNSQSKGLSGGQKRKLQLACMFIGNSSVCLIDECTSELDPLSRRVIWEILLEQRSKRSIIFTTHFLDEVDVLADHIVILSKGKGKCHGPAAELKNLYGGGYKVLVPLNAPRFEDLPYPATLHQERCIYATPDSRSAAQLCSRYASIGVTDVSVSGPQVEDVFLRVADEPELARSIDETQMLDFEMTPGELTSFVTQTWVLFRKRFTVLRRFWWPYFYVLAIPLIVSPNLQAFLRGFEQPSCELIAPVLTTRPPRGFTWTDECELYGCATFAVAPTSANDTLFGLVEEGFDEVSDINPDNYGDFSVVLDSRDALIRHIEDKREDNYGGVFAGSEDQAPLLAYRVMDDTVSTGGLILNTYSQMQGNVEIIGTQSTFARTRQTAATNGILFAIFFTLVMAIYPAAFVLYPAIEQSRKVRALEYANGVRRAPLWVAYGLFDFIFVIVISVAVTAIFSIQVVGKQWNGPIWVLLPILALYGLAAVLMGYVISHFVTGPLKAFIATAGVSLVMFAITAIVFAVGSSRADAGNVDSTILGVSFGLYLILPIGNVFRAILIGLNVRDIGCLNGFHTPPGHIKGYGGPILYLVLQVNLLLFLIVWIEGDVALFRRKSVVKGGHRDDEIELTRISNEVRGEGTRVENSESDFLRALHLTKTFGSNTAVDDVTFGLPESDVMALIGPNGAGKSTLVNMIQSELSPDSGKVLLRGEDARSRSAQRHLGVCPQYDALDLMNTREHLAFYARVKGIKDVKGNVNHVMARLGLTPHANTLATKLSGGNKRKLSLAIALMGTPPVMVLDEPTSAMDAVAKRAFWRLIKEIAPNRCLLLTTHSMEEADTLATRTAILAKRLLAVGTTQNLRERYNNVYYVSLLLHTAPNSTPEEMERIRGWVVSALPNVQFDRDMMGGQVHFTIPGSSPVAQVIEIFEREKDQRGIEYYNIGAATLERVFLSVVRENQVPEEDGRDKKGFLKWLQL